MATIATLAINLIGNASGLKSTLGEAQQSIKATSESLKNIGTKMTTAVSLPIRGVAGAALKGAAEMEQLEVAFTTMLRSGDKAKALMADLTAFSAETPFEMPQVVNAGKMLLAYGVSAEDVKDTLRQLGDVSAGVGADIGDIAYLYGTARVQGRLFAADINQFTNRGIPIISALAATMGVAEGSIKKMTEEGKIGFAELSAALDYLTTNGGQFEGLMAAQSQTLAGLFSTLKDNIGITLSTIGRSIVEAFDLRGKLTSALEVLGQVKDFIVNLAQTNPQLLKTAVIIAAVAASIGPLLVGLGMVMGALANLVPVISVLGSAFAFLVSPLGLVVAGLAALFYFDVGGIRTKFMELAASIWEFGSQTVSAFSNYREVVLDAGFGSIEAQEAIGLFPESLQGVLGFVDNLIGAFSNYRAVVLDAGFGSIEAQEAISLFPQSLQGVIGKADELMAKLRDVPSLATDLKDAISWIWEGNAAEIDWWGDITNGLVQMGIIGQETGDKLAESLFNAGIVIGDIKAKIESGWVTIRDSVTIAVENFSWSDFVESLTWENVIGAALDWGAYITPIAWDAALTVIDWAQYIGQLTWDNAVIPALEWANYIAPIAWDALVATLSDWGAYIASLDWTTIITTAIDWAMWIPALTWTAFVYALDWGIYILGIAWDTFISVLDWAFLSGEGPDWSAFVSVLTWENLVAALDWSAYILAFAWDSFITKLEWTGAIDKMSNWGQYIPTLSWEGFVAKLEDWGTWVVNLPWADYVAKLAEWSAFINPLVWTQFVFSLLWSQFVPNLQWPSLSWPGWKSFIPSFTWPTIPAFPSWDSLIPDWFGGGSDPANNALGTSYWRGGATWVGERRPELVMLPRGSQVIPQHRVGAAGAGGPMVVIEHAEVRNETDIYRLAYAVDDLRRRRRR